MNAIQSALIAPSTFVLTHLDLYDWGAFAGRHRAEIDLAGTAVIGPTGSGKTTLVDALMTLLCANPRYNLASTGGHESDRDLVSYVRGVSGQGSGGDDNQHVARPGKTVTGIAARFASAEQELSVGALLWFEGTSSAAADLKKWWFFATDPKQTLDSWLQVHHEGGVRGLKQLERDSTGLWLYPSKTGYLARLRDFFEVGENAFTLLNRAAGLKQLNSIDEVFRELVLDDHSAFQRADEVAASFDDLAEIHEELETARRQQQSLLPIATFWQQYQTHGQSLQERQQLKAILPRWYAEHGYRLWGKQAERLDESAHQVRNREREQKDLVQRLEDEETALRDSYLQIGGAGIQQLEETIETQKKLVEERQRFALQYCATTRRLGLDEQLSAATLQVNQQAARHQLDALQGELSEQKRAAFEAGVQALGARNRADALRKERDEVLDRPGSNIPPGQQAFRAQLAAHLELPEQDLPFVAELVEVKVEQQGWRGAIERAIGNHRQRIMVPPTAIEAALAWVNRRHNALHVRLLEVHAPNDPINFFADGFTGKLSFKSHPYRESLKKLLADIDRRCVDTPEQLRRTPHAMTIQGLMSGKAGHFEKQDQKSLSDDWMTGFDNRDRLAAIAAQIDEAEKDERQCQAQSEAAQQLAQTTEQRGQLLQGLLDLHFEQIDLPGAEQRMVDLGRRLSALTDPDSDTTRAKTEWENARTRKQEKAEQLSELTKERIGLETAHASAQKSQKDEFRRLGEGLTDEQRGLAAAHLQTPLLEQLDELVNLERDAEKDLQHNIDKIQELLRQGERDLIQQMGRAQREDRGALTNIGQEVDDVPHYLERLRVLTEEALPEKQQRFTAYLNQSSDQGVTQLLGDIDNEVSMIEERIDDLNATLRRVDFQAGRYLRLIPQKVVHESLRTLQLSQRQLRSARLQDDGGASHFKALRHMVALLRDASDRRKTLGARALLDPRYRLTFSVAVIDRTTGATIETRTGSQGGSGGEKESIASYVLTASLSYALCPDGSSRPLFGTLVLDEAFSKSSQAVAGRIISALTEFGLHPLFVTPNKELRLLRNHTRSAIVVHRRGQQATLTSLSWQALDEHARQRRSPP